MIYLYHGQDSASSRLALDQVKKKYDPLSITVFNEKNVSYKELPALLNNTSMFGDKQLIIIEGKLDTSLIDLKKEMGDTDLLIWVNSKLRSNETLIKTVMDLKGKVEVFEETPDKEIFPFLDAIADRNRKLSLTLFKQLVENDKEPIYIHTMIVWQFRNLIAPGLLKEGFAKQKALKSKGNFTDEELQRIYYQLLQIELQIKSSETIPEVLIEQLLVKITN